MITKLPIKTVDMRKKNLTLDSFYKLIKQNASATVFHHMQYKWSFWNVGKLLNNANFIKYTQMGTESRFVLVGQINI